MFHVVKGFTPFLLISLYLYLAVCGPVYTILGKNSWLSIAGENTTDKNLGFLESTVTNLKLHENGAQHYNLEIQAASGKYRCAVLALCIC